MLFRSLRGHPLQYEPGLGALSALSAAAYGVFRGESAIDAGLTRKQLAALRSAGVIERVLPDTYRMTAVPRSNRQALKAALLWAGREAAAAGLSAAELYELEGVHADRPEIVVPSKSGLRSADIAVHRSDDRAALMVRRLHRFRVTGIEASLMAAASSLSGEQLELACEDARRRRLTSVPALRAYLARHGRSGRPGVADLRRLLRELDPVHASRSTLEVKTRRLLVANAFVDFVRELPLEWNGKTYYFDFAFLRRRTILETNGRRWHDDPTDYEDDNEKWSVPARHGFRIVFATWLKVTQHPHELLAELEATLAA